MSNTEILVLLKSDLKHRFEFIPFEQQSIGKRCSEPIRLNSFSMQSIFKAGLFGFRTSGPRACTNDKLAAAELPLSLHTIPLLERTQCWCRRFSAVYETETSLRLLVLIEFFLIKYCLYNSISTAFSSFSSFKRISHLKISMTAINCPLCSGCTSFAVSELRRSSPLCHTDSLSLFVIQPLWASLLYSLFELVCRTASLTRSMYRSLYVRCERFPLSSVYFGVLFNEELSLSRGCSTYIFTSAGKSLCCLWCVVFFVFHLSSDEVTLMLTSPPPAIPSSKSMVVVV